MLVLLFHFRLLSLGEYYRLCLLFYCKQQQGPVAGLSQGFLGMALS